MASLVKRDQMYANYGFIANRTCGECRFCVSQPKNPPTPRHNFKVVCLKSPTSLRRGETVRSTWVKGFTACGLFKESV